MLAIFALTLFSLCIGVLLARLAQSLQSNGASVVEQINALLPQTQCAQCGYPGCRPYAEAIASNTAQINQCPPGGSDTIEQLARLLDRPVIPLNTEFGQTNPAVVAIIDEDTCIGCTLCIHACPVDAIVGASKLMHTIITAECTGCELCLPPCPVDCIDLVPPPVNHGGNQHAAANPDPGTTS